MAVAMNNIPGDVTPPPLPPPPVSMTNPPHTTLIDRVTDLEHALNALTDQHNRFVEAAARELGI